MESSLYHKKVVPRPSTKMERSRPPVALPLITANLFACGFSVHTAFTREPVIGFLQHLDRNLYLIRSVLQKFLATLKFVVKSVNHSTGLPVSLLFPLSVFLLVNCNVFLLPIGTSEQYCPWCRYYACSGHLTNISWMKERMMNTLIISSVMSTRPSTFSAINQSLIFGQLFTERV